MCETRLVRRAVLLFNPNAGRRPAHRLRVIESVAEALRNHSVETKILATEGPGTAGRQAADACEQGADTVFACGGDGTVHEVLQGIAFHPATALGVIPLGSANVLARHLRLPLDPVRAAHQQLNYLPRTIAVGRVTYQSPIGEQLRYFLVLAGAGADGALVYRMLGSGKHRLGRVMYYLRSAHLFLSTRFPAFPVTAGERKTHAVSAMAVRVGDLGGLFSPLIRGASVDDSQLLLTTVAAPAHLSLPLWFTLGWARLHRWNRYVETHRVNSFACAGGETGNVQVQADGEWLGRTPMTVELIANGIRLLMPPPTSPTAR
jgi:YegS/Rv2252/BmrU family lipid kinase